MAYHRLVLASVPDATELHNLKKKKKISFPEFGLVLVQLMPSRLYHAVHCGVELCAIPRFGFRELMGFQGRVRSEWESISVLSVGTVSF